jgi:crotonobetainyl-CoA:carnitine CoA-transferase CaiB-like acyl-CoA transferase
MTGFGQDGPLADRAGPRPHLPRILTGALHAIGPKDGRPAGAARSTSSPTTAAAPCSWLRACSPRWSRAHRPASGQVVDAAMVDGASMLMAPTFSYMASGFWKDRAASTCSTAAPPSTTSTRPPTAAMSPSPAWSRSSSRTPTDLAPPSQGPGAETGDILRALGLPAAEIDAAFASGLVTGRT